jgi:hypothetical protein
MPEKVFIRGMPDELWRAIKARASLDGMSISRAVQEALRVYLSGLRLGTTGDASDPWRGIVGLGRGGASDVSERHDHYVAEARRGRKKR